MKLSKTSIAIFLSKLESFYSQKVRVEQYPTPSEIASTMLWRAYEIGDIENKEIVDLGAGTGILGLGTILLGAKKITFIDEDKEALSILKKNLKKLESEYNLPECRIIESNINNIDINCDTIIMNPPFGTKIIHADRDFLNYAFNHSRSIYTLHKTETKDFIVKHCEKNKFKVEEIYDLNFPIKASHPFHKKPKKDIKVSFFVIRHNP